MDKKPCLIVFARRDKRVFFISLLDIIKMNLSVEVVLKTEAIVKYSDRKV